MTYEGDASLSIDASIIDASLDSSIRDASPTVPDADALDASLADASLVDAGCAECNCNEVSYVPDRSCGVGYCRATNRPSACVAGIESLCVPGLPRNSDDTTCDLIDDDCDGLLDEDYQSISCGQGYCRASSTASRCTNGVEQLCLPGTPLASIDRTGDGVDDDCDGQVDEDVCVPRSDSYGRGAYNLLPPANCTTVIVELWGGGGASGDARAGYWMNVTSGNGGAGGYARQTLSLTGSSELRLYVGAGAPGCGAAGLGALAAHSGGTGGSTRAQAGSNGQDGSLIGGTGGTPTSGGDGGDGSYGGGGGGAGDDPGFAPHGNGGGGGAASVLTFAGMSVVAGGGGGGGGAGSDIATAGHSGSDGGSGCNGPGLAATAYGGGGGGGGRCVGQKTQVGIARTPHDPNGVLPSSAAFGGNAALDCAAGGDGYAIVSFSP